MLFKSTLALAFVALANIASASTPACVLSVVGDTSNPDDLSSICGSKTIQSTIESKCGDNAETALKFFSNNCKSYGFTVAEAETNATETASGFVTAASTATVGSSCHTHSGCASSATSTSGSASGAPSGTASGTTPGGTGAATSSGVGEASASPSFAGAITGQQLSGTTFAAALFFAAAAIL
ncbi:Period circadian protein [Penicillium herquei]|nr:Period circadian protein [Penicillium herquei]